MRSIWTIVVAVSLVATGSAAANTRFCTQDEKQLANKLHEQNTDPAKSCYRAANGDITTLDTSRLCPLPECASWLAFMAKKSPDCYFDSSNYAVVYAAKNADCTGDMSVSASASANSSASLRSGSSGGVTTSSNDSSADRNISPVSDDQSLNATDSVANIGGSAETGSGDVGADVTAPTPTPTEDLTVEDTTTPTPTPTQDLALEDTTAPSTDSSGSSAASTTPAPTSSGASRLSTIFFFTTLFLFAVIDL